ncbi:MULTISPECIES: hypothetical protein [unclassified Nocardioides]|uniref:hypothetical protein n=1 Tax=unclassified Nocardioides TaxID=2615069 RepID=UPI0026663392|nr:hypothetical protein [Nocardioides sp. Arc9.136]WKN49358.1 hypothetical protein OSR43_04320 [Nocardioides sp. Arc9.136]
MSESSNETGDQRNPEQQEIAEVQEQLDEQADGDGLAAEAGSGDETGLTEG